MNDPYFEWLLEIVCEGKYMKRLQYRRLLGWLYKTEFVYVLPIDSSRAEDGLDLRVRFGDPDITNKPCSVLEVMVALAIRCEEHIMANQELGDRTGKWFWGMVGNLGLDQMSDFSFDPEYVDFVISKFLFREYDPSGKGGLFTVKDPREDMRTVDIWCQMCWYLSEII